MVLWKRLSLAVLPLIGVVVIAFMLYHLNRYENAVTCATPTTKSRDCIVYKSAVILDRWTEKHISCGSPQGGCTDNYSYHVVAQTESSKVDLVLDNPREDLKASDKVEVVSWAGRDIAIRAHGQVSGISGWHPLFAKISMIVTAILLLVLGILFAVFGEAPYNWAKRLWTKRPSIAILFMMLGWFMVFFGILLGWSSMHLFF